MLVMILAPLAAMLVQMAISRTREYRPTGRPPRSAASRSGSRARCRRSSSWRRACSTEPAERNPASAHLFIINPLHMGGVDSLFRTHPSTADRMRRLRELAGQTAAAGAGRGPWG